MKRVAPEEPNNPRPVNPAFFIMSRWVYILQSTTTGRYYCGQTMDLKARLLQHNDPNNTLSKTTNRFKGPGEMILAKAVESGSEAVQLERKIKKRGIKRYLQDVGGC